MIQQLLIRPERRVQSKQQRWNYHRYCTKLSQQQKQQHENQKTTRKDNEVDAIIVATCMSTTGCTLSQCEIVTKVWYNYWCIRLLYKSICIQNIVNENNNNNFIRRRRRRRSITSKETVTNTTKKTRYRNSLSLTSSTSFGQRLLSLCWIFIGVTTSICITLPSLQWMGTVAVVFVEATTTITTSAFHVPSSSLSLSLTSQLLLRKQKKRYPWLYSIYNYNPVLSLTTIPTRITNRKTTSIVLYNTQQDLLTQEDKDENNGENNNENNSNKNKNPAVAVNSSSSVTSSSSSSTTKKPEMKSSSSFWTSNNLQSMVTTFVKKSIANVTINALEQLERTIIGNDNSNNNNSNQQQQQQQQQVLSSLSLTTSSTPITTTTGTIPVVSSPYFYATQEASIIQKQLQTTDIIVVDTKKEEDVTPPSVEKTSESNHRKELLLSIEDTLSVAPSSDARREQQQQQQQQQLTISDMNNNYKSNTDPLRDTIQKTVQYNQEPVQEQIQNDEYDKNEDDDDDTIWNDAIQFAQQRIMDDTGGFKIATTTTTPGSNIPTASTILTDTKKRIKLNTNSTTTSSDKNFEKHRQVKSNENRKSIAQAARDAIMAYENQQQQLQQEIMIQSQDRFEKEQFVQKSEEEQVSALKDNPTQATMITVPNSTISETDLANKPTNDTSTVLLPVLQTSSSSLSLSSSTAVVEEVESSQRSSKKKTKNSKANNKQIQSETSILLVDNSINTTVTKMNESSSDYSKWTILQLKQYLTNKNVSYTTKMKKADIISLVQTTSEQKQEPHNLLQGQQQTIDHNDTVISSSSSSSSSNNALVEQDTSTTVTTDNNTNTNVSNNWKIKTIRELQIELRRRGIKYSSTSRKAQLVTLLIEFDTKTS